MTKLKTKRVSAFPQSGRRVHVCAPSCSTASSTRGCCQVCSSAALPAERWLRRALLE